MWFYIGITRHSHGCRFRWLAGCPSIRLSVHRQGRAGLGYAAAPAEVCALPKGYRAGSVIYKKQQISPVSVGDFAQGLVALPRLPRRDSEWKRKSRRGEIPDTWRGR